MLTAVTDRHLVSMDSNQEVKTKHGNLSKSHIDSLLNIILSTEQNIKVISFVWTENMHTLCLITETKSIVRALFDAALF